MDYLGAALNEWFNHNNRKNFVLKKSNLVVGFFSLTWYRKTVKFKLNLDYLFRGGKHVPCTYLGSS